MFQLTPARRLSLFILLLGVAFPLRAAKPVGGCEHHLTSEYSYFDVRENLESENLQLIKDPSLKNELVLPFPEGAMGYARLRIQSLAEGMGEVVKDYPLGYGRRCRNDLALLGLLGRVLKGQSHVGFAVTKARRSRSRLFDFIHCRRIITTYIPGRTLHDLLNDPQTPSALAVKLERIYLSKLDHLEEELRRAGLVASFMKVEPEAKYFRDRKLDGAPIGLAQLHNGNVDLYSAIIKSDNIIVDPYDVNKMTVVDPF